MRKGKHSHTDTSFRTCSKCGFEWKSRQQFINDSEIVIIGYQANHVDLVPGFFYFNHSCKGTLTIRANAFEDLYDGPIYENNRKESELYHDYCLRQKGSRHFLFKCECVYVKQIIRIFEEKRFNSSPNIAVNEV